MPVERQSQLGLNDVRLYVAPARSGAGWRALARVMDVSAGKYRPADRRVAAAPAPRRILETWFGLRKLRGYPMRRLRRRRLVGWLFQCHRAPACRLESAVQGPDRPFGAQIPAFRDAGPGDRVPAGNAALVGPLAQRPGN